MRATLLPKFVVGKVDDVLASSVTTTCAPATAENTKTAKISPTTILANRITTSNLEVDPEMRRNPPAVRSSRSESAFRFHLLSIKPQSADKLAQGPADFFAASVLDIAHS